MDVPESMNHTNAAHQPPAISEPWLDQLTHGLTEHGWVSQDVSHRLAPGLLTALCQEVQALHRTNAMIAAGVGRGTGHVRDRSVRRDRIAWLQGITTPQMDLFRFLDLLRQALNERLFLGLRRFEAHYATYEPGDFYRKHVDSFTGRASRIVSLVLYLNEGWRPEHGGALQVFNRDSEHEICGTIMPEAGRMVLFMSEEIPHEVLTAQRARYSLACWFRQDEVPIPL